MKYVYSFKEGNKDMRNILGGKGANLCEMAKIGLPVPNGFIVSTDACNNYKKDLNEYNSSTCFSLKNCASSTKIHDISSNLSYYFSIDSFSFKRISTFLLRPILDSK